MLSFCFCACVDAKISFFRSFFTFLKLLFNIIKSRQMCFSDISFKVFYLCTSFWKKLLTYLFLSGQNSDFFSYAQLTW